MGRVLALLGAGASVPLFPSTDDLTAALRVDQKWSWPSSPNPDSLFPAKHSGIACATFFEGLVQFVESFPGHPKVNFEDLIEFVETVADVRQGQDDASYYPAGWFLRQVYPGKPSTPIGFFEGNRLRTVAQHARLVILRTIHERARQHAASFGSAGLNVFLRQLTRVATVHIASLNYDNLVDGAGVQLDAGFRPPGGEPYHVFNPGVVASAPWSSTGVLVMPLHGSVHFGLAVHEDGIELVWFEDLEAAHQSFASGFQMRAGQRDLQDLYPLMITGRRKVVAAQGPPFSTYLSKLRQSASEAETWVIAGYGGGDTHINVQLSQVLAWRLRHRQAPRVLVCDQGDAAALSQLACRIFTPLPAFVPLSPGPWHELRMGKRESGSQLGWMWGQGIDAMTRTSWITRV